MSPLQELEDAIRVHINVAHLAKRLDRPQAEILSCLEEAGVPIRAIRPPGAKRARYVAQLDGVEAWLHGCKRRTTAEVRDRAALIERLSAERLGLPPRDRRRS